MLSFIVINLLSLCWLRLITHHRLIHFLWFHIIKFIKIWLWFLLFWFLNFLFMLNNLLLWFWMLLLFIIKLIIFLELLAILFISSWMFNILIWFDNVWWWSLNFLINIIWMLCWFRIITYYWIIHFLRFHVIKFIEILLRSLLCNLLFIIMYFLGLIFRFEI
jgi:hypothetical protein